MELTPRGRTQGHVLTFERDADSFVEEDKELQSKWAAIEKLPTFKRIKTSFVDVSQEEGASSSSSSTVITLRSGSKRVADVSKLGAVEKRLFIDKLIKHIENDNLQLLQKLRERMDRDINGVPVDVGTLFQEIDKLVVFRVNVKLPTVEVKYKNLNVRAECEVVQGKALPTLWNSFSSSLSGFMKNISCTSQGAEISILNDVSGIIKPSRLTLLLGPPGCGKTTLLKALAGKLEQSLKFSGEISYNGYKLDEFVPQKTSAYISQYDLHVPEMTVRETIDFSARCQGVGGRADLVAEISRREIEEGIIPDPDIDTYMKAISVEGQSENLQTEYVLKILGLDICADILVGDALDRGISGGQKKRLTTGEMIVGPIKALFMDEISTGLDSSTTFQIVTCLQQLVHITDATAVLSLLQPAPETYELFDDLILMAEGKIVYHGPRSQALQFFKDCGFWCPERKGVADFLQEVISKKDQRQYWYRTDIPYKYVSVDEFSQIFKSSYWGRMLNDELSRPDDKSESHKNALSFSKYSLGKLDLFKACMKREILLMKRNSFIYVFKTAQLTITAIITMTVFIRTQRAVDLIGANYLLGSLYYTLVRLMTNGVAELIMTITRLPVVDKQKEFYLYPAWAYCLPSAILKIPFSVLDSIVWTSVTYYVIGYSPEITRQVLCLISCTHKIAYFSFTLQSFSYLSLSYGIRFLRQFLLLVTLHMSSTSMCRCLASVFKTDVAATTVGSLVLVLMFLFGGFILPRPSLPRWLRWGFWLSPMSYGEIGITLNEFLAPRWQKIQEGNITVGREVLRSHGLDFDSHFYWLSVGALLGFTILFDFGFVLALSYIKQPKMSRALVSKKRLSQLRERETSNSVELKSVTVDIGHTPRENQSTGKMVLPFEPLSIAFKDVQYFVDIPPEMKKHGSDEKRLQLLCDITGAFRPGILTALMGVSGAGKTTLMDVLSGRKTGGIIEGDIRIGGYPKVQKTFERVSGYCEQNDIHSPYITVEESVTYSAWLRLPTEIDSVTKGKFVEEVLETIELDYIKDCLVGIPGQSGLSTEQRKRLTIAVELVSNPSIIFMDEPTSGLDARAAAVVMRAVKNVVATGRTTVCTIHQPSIDIFETFDELILMKSGGRIIYSGMLGHHSSRLIEYFQNIPGVPKIKDNYNPATWMLEATSASVEAELKIDFAQIYKESHLCRDTLELVRELSEPLPGSKDLHFSTRFPQNSLGQFMACLWKQHLSYWRSPEYNLTRFIFMIVCAIIFGAVFWQKGKKINNQQDLFNVLGSMYIAVIFLGLNYCSTILPYVATERAVLYREKFAGMYSSTAYSFAQVVIEIPYILVQSILYVAITYPMIGFHWSVQKVFWYFYTTFCTFLYFVYLGMMVMSMSSNLDIASVLSTAVYTIFNLFSGFLMPGPKIPKWWIWCYWICPTAWSLNGLLTSQYGDIEKEVLVFGERKSVGSFLRDYYGFRHDRLSLVAVVLIVYPIVYASLFAYFIKKMNYQKR
ncbi:Pleiotropic drug resistance protein 3 [Glycine soja]|uniref:pleiotropic drug resistance protein 3 isoform X1 n=1 Tax=Glycine max TaxID=3847 RepID=UPI000E21BFE2|nr:pleiotropic drug resistance protein 3 isoform X1 [Glycine max]KAH1243467.1 Pleiotropic drug resistance protein 3 [Glycine max]|eukprot:XP_025985124.1 pleiotropic drug resistance protein 3 isoform X1 [Glycine max]